MRLAQTSLLILTVQAWSSPAGVLSSPVAKGRRPEPEPGTGPPRAVEGACVPCAGWAVAAGRGLGRGHPALLLTPSLFFIHPVSSWEGEGWESLAAQPGTDGGSSRPPVTGGHKCCLGQTEGHINLVLIVTMAEYLFLSLLQ